MKEVDVAILGGGLAGNLLARQLRREQPELSVAVFEPTETTQRKVGESTVEIGTNYLLRRHGLSFYLNEQHLPKNGLRYFFDTPEKDAELTKMSELGSDHIPLFPTFQLDRQRFEADLRRMNVESGVDMRIGETVKDVDLGDGHRVVSRSDGGETEHRARWVVDCTGRSQLLSRKLDLSVPVKDHALAAVWGRFENVVDIDSIRDHEWRQRVRYTSRVLSTNHFCYRGYWIWFIPLGHGVTSVGVVGEKDVFPRGARTKEGFRAFLDQHRAVASLLEKAELMDVGGFSQLAYGTKRFFHASERWAVIGDAAAFVDPLYSPGTDFIAVQCDMVCDLIRRDVEDDDAAEMGELLDRYMRYRFDATIPLYQGQYPCLGSFEILRAKWNYDLNTYYALWLDEFLRDEHLSPRHVKEQLRRRFMAMDAQTRIRDLFVRMADELEKRGAYHRANLGEFNDGTDLAHFWREVGTEHSTARTFELALEVVDAVRADVRKTMQSAPG